MVSCEAVKNQSFDVSALQRIIGGQARKRVDSVATQLDREMIGRRTAFSVNREAEDHSRLILLPARYRFNTFSPSRPAQKLRPSISLSSTIVGSELPSAPSPWDLPLPPTFISPVVSAAILRRQITACWRVRGVRGEDVEVPEGSGGRIRHGREGSALQYRRALRLRLGLLDPLPWHIEGVILSSVSFIFIVDVLMNASAECMLHRIACLDSIMVYLVSVRASVHCTAVSVELLIWNWTLLGWVLITSVW